MVCQDKEENTILLNISLILHLNISLNTALSQCKDLKAKKKKIKFFFRELRQALDSHLNTTCTVCEKRNWKILVVMSDLSGFLLSHLV